MCDCFFDELAYPRYNSATATFINILISEFLQKEPRVRKRGEAKSQEFTSLMRTIFANLIISKAEPIIVSLMTGGQHHKNKIFVNCINELVSQGSITLHKGEFHKDRSTIIPSWGLQERIISEASPADIISPNRAITLSATEKKDGKKPNHPAPHPFRR